MTSPPLSTKAVPGKVKRSKTYHAAYIFQINFPRTPGMANPVLYEWVDLLRKSVEDAEIEGKKSDHIATIKPDFIETDKPGSCRTF